MKILKMYLKVKYREVIKDTYLYIVNGAYNPHKLKKEVKIRKNSL
jgi:hypothetical protein